MLYKVYIVKTSEKKGYTIMIYFFQDNRSTHSAVYIVYVKTKKEANEWEKKNKDWLENTAKNFVGV